MAWVYKVTFDPYSVVSNFYRVRATTQSSYSRPAIRQELVLRFPNQLTPGERTALRNLPGVTAVVEQQISPMNMVMSSETVAGSPPPGIVPDEPQDQQPPA